jgi:hypothetical protein
MAYLVTFNCYGKHLRGTVNGSVDRVREERGGPIEPSAALVNYQKRAMTHAEASLDPRESSEVLRSIRETCAHRNWTLLAAHVRSTHAHLIVDGIEETSNAIRDFKAYASRGIAEEFAVAGPAVGTQSCFAMRPPCALPFAISWMARVRKWQCTSLPISNSES